MPAAMVAFLGRRSEAFAKATTTGAGKQMVYGSGERVAPPKKPKRRVGR